MQIAQVLAGYTLGGADMLRRAMGKKKPEEMAKQRAVFEDGAKGQGVDPELAMKIFDLVEKFAGYGFNKSHSAAYALVSYQTAWLKAHYPAHFMAATMSSDMDKTDKIVTFIEEVRNMGLNLLPPDVNQGEFQFTVDDENNIIFGLGAIKGLGEGPVEAIIEARQSGPFADLFDFCARVDNRKVNKRAMEALVRSGSLDTIGPGVDLDYDRALMLIAIPEAVKAAEQSHANAQAGISDLFGEVVPSSTNNDDVYAEFRNTRRWSMKQRLNGEKDTLGLYLTGHPIDEFDEELNHLVSSRIANVKPDKNRQSIAGLVVAFRVMKTKRGDNMAFITLDDRTGRMEVAIFSDVYEEHRSILVKDAMLVVEGQITHDDYSGGLKMRADGILDLTQARQANVAGIRLLWNERNLNSDFVKELKSTIESERGGHCALSIQYTHENMAGEVKLGAQWQIHPSDELVMNLKGLYGNDNVELQYRH